MLIKRILKWHVFYFAILLLLNIWALAALWFDLPIGLPWRVLVIIFVLAFIAIALFRIRPLFRAGLVPFFIFLFTLVWWLLIPASNSRDWSPEYQYLAQVTHDGNTVTINNLRNFKYNGKLPATPRWEKRTYNLDKLIGVDIFFSYWGSEHIAHTILSWQFENSPPLAISIETRREKGEFYSAILGFFRQYELYYVVADEQDLIKVRTNDRGEDVYLYRLNTAVATAKDLLLDYFKIINRLTDKPIWYNAATHNCTTTIRQHAKHIAKNDPFNWRILLNGHLPELAYQRGTINNTMTYDQIRKASYVSEKGKLAGEDKDYSNLIRVDLPARP